MVTGITLKEVGEVAKVAGSIDWEADVTLVAEVQAFMKELTEMDQQHAHLDWFVKNEKRFVNLIGRLIVTSDMEQRTHVMEYWQECLKRAASAHVDSLLSLVQSTHNKDDMFTLMGMYWDTQHQLSDLGMMDEYDQLTFAVNKGDSEFSHYFRISDLEYRITGVEYGNWSFRGIKEKILSANISSDERKDLLQKLATAGKERVLFLIGVYKNSVATMEQYRRVYDEVSSFLIQQSRIPDYLQIGTELRVVVVENYRSCIRRSFYPYEVLKNKITNDSVLFASEKEMLLSELGQH